MSFAEDYPWIASIAWEPPTFPPAPAPQYTTYVLCHAGVELLRCEASITPPFTVGEALCLHATDTGKQCGPYVVEHITRQLVYRTKQTEPPVCVPLAGQEIRVELRAVGEAHA